MVKDDHSRTRKLVFDEAQLLLNAGLISGLGPAQLAVSRLKGREYNTRVFYNSNNSISVDAISKAFHDVADQVLYSETRLKTGKVSSGKLSKLLDIEKVAVGEIVKFQSRDNESTHLVARIKDVYEDKNGFFLTPYHYDDVKKEGKQLVDERENLYRVEFDPFISNYVLGMFIAWNNFEFGKTKPLILYANTKLDRFFGIDED